ncbi:MAG: translation elongation factor 4 [Acholeplasmataceae bacterium]|nr:translation elongation factor 4 [Acholeplasmataceae bacterium]MDD4469419.1 translation elongation factor 4 [Acholeplasmataceae bacterium]MDD4823962.1 translation elongation factor 4 [Acholeplasmataceae bacterium]
MKERQKYIRNFSIIAHIDHGKSTLADRILEKTQTVEKRDMKSQMLDGMDLERERGITIKLTAVEVLYQAKDGNDYIFHLIDTPGHVDFTYEVSRSLAACEGALLVVDAAQGIQAQTLANVYLALENNLEIIPIINKIDLPNANPQRVLKEIEDIIGIPTDNAVLVSAKSGEGIEDVLEAIVKYIPAPEGSPNRPLEALIFDSIFDPFRGAIPFIRVKNGSVKKGDIIQMMATNSTYEVVEVGVHTPKEFKKEILLPGDVGYLTASIKVIDHVHVGDTITLKENPTKNPFPGYRPLKPVVFSGLYPTENDRYNDLKDALEKLALNDASLVYEPESSVALGFGYRAGFLGLLHMEVVQERIEREFGIELIATAPSVIYQVNLTNHTTIEIDNPSKLPSPQEIESIMEPYVKATIMCPSEYIGSVMDLSQKKRGIFLNMSYLDPTRAEIKYELPLSEIVFDFFDKLKSATRGYASFDYELSDYKASKLVKLDILLNGEIVDALSSIVHKDFAYNRGRNLCLKLKDIIPRQMFEIPVQASIGNKVIARETIKALRKDVISKCYGGDISRKRKLLEKQKEGKKKMKSIGRVDIPQEAFLTILKSDD